MSDLWRKRLSLLLAVLGVVSCIHGMTRLAIAQELIETSRVVWETPNGKRVETRIKRGETLVLIIDRVSQTDEEPPTVSVRSPGTSFELFADGKLVATIDRVSGILGRMEIHHSAQVRLVDLDQDGIFDIIGVESKNYFLVDENRDIAPLPTALQKKSRDDSGLTLFKYVIVRKCLTTKSKTRQESLIENLKKWRDLFLPDIVEPVFADDGSLKKLLSLSLDQFEKHLREADYDFAKMTLPSVEESNKRER